MNAFSAQCAPRARNAAVLVLLLVSLVFAADLNAVRPSVRMLGIEFATLDGADPRSFSRGCQESALPLPDGWAIANSQLTAHRNALGAFSWGTSCLVFDDGSSLTPLLEPCASSNQLIVDTSGDKPTYSVAQCDQRILIYNTRDSIERFKKISERADFALPVPESYNVWVPKDNNSYYDVDTTHRVMHFIVPFVDHDGQVRPPIECVFHVNQTEGQHGSFVQQGFRVGVETRIDAVFGHLPPEAYYLELTVHFGAQHGSSNHPPHYSTRRYFEESDKWAYGEISYIPQYQVVRIEIALHLYAPGGASASWKNFLLAPIPNLLENPSMSTRSPLLVESWNDFGEGYMPDIPDNNLRDDLIVVEEAIESFESVPSFEVASSSEVEEGALGGDAPPWESILMLSTHETDGSQGAYQSVYFPVPSGQIRRLYFGAYSKATAVTGGVDGNYCAVLDITYVDGSALYGQALRFTTGTHGWEYRDRILQLNRPVAELNVTLLFREHEGAVWFDDVVLRVARGDDMASSQKEAELLRCRAGVVGSGLVTMVNEDVDHPLVLPLSIAGEYVLFRSELLSIHVRMGRRTAPDLGVAVTAVAMRVAGGATGEEAHTITVQLPSVFSRNTTQPEVWVRSGAQEEARLVGTCETVFLPGTGVFTCTQISARDHALISSMHHATQFKLEVAGVEVYVLAANTQHHAVLTPVLRLSESVCDGAVGLVGSCAEQSLSFRNGGKLDLPDFAAVPTSQVSEEFSLHVPSTIPSAISVEVAPSTAFDYEEDHKHDARHISTTTSTTTTTTTATATTTIASSSSSASASSFATASHSNAGSGSIAGTFRVQRDSGPLSASRIRAFQESWLVEPSTDEALFVYPPGKTTESYHEKTPPQFISYEDLKDSGSPTTKAYAACRRQHITTLQQWCVLEVMYTDDAFIVQDYHLFEAILAAVQVPLTVELGEQAETFYAEEEEPSWWPYIAGGALLAIAVVVAAAYFVYTKRRAIWVWVLDLDADEQRDYEMDNVSAPDLQALVVDDAESKQD